MEEYDETAYIETLCPIDRDKLDANGVPIPDISDCELNTLLTLISREKGHRITVILDCCHSGGATLQDMLLTGEKYLRHYPGYRSILSKDWYPDMDSHVVLAACKEYQFAKAIKVKQKDGVVEYAGVFTNSLLRALQSGHWRKETTYADLVESLDKTPHQTPVVAGKHKTARLWYQE
ncbi:uncharacterized protein ARMOST_21463 [Armillaria ostoyae]|uniref:Uncharacterized protein n=1 Tax=Armillaria ostoyae TaxID=47428 RepID=A0A284SA93_ARMOS|nr:uncharacterized protein ARMOST_21463 [Armillaria ostoyae]